MVRLVLLGGPGAGKGTQACRLAKHLQIPMLATGDILRESIAAQTALGRQAQTYLENGELVPDEIMIQFMRERLLKPDVEVGWILDGYPRTAFQAEELDFLLEELEQRLTWAIYLKVSPQLLAQRSLQRGLLDDQPEIIARRLQLFEERTIPILEYYEYRGHLLTVAGDSSPAAITETILTSL